MFRMLSTHQEYFLYRPAKFVLFVGKAPSLCILYALGAIGYSPYVTAKLWPIPISLHVLFLGSTQVKILNSSISPNLIPKLFCFQMIVNPTHIPSFLHTYYIFQLSKYTFGCFSTVNIFVLLPEAWLMLEYLVSLYLNLILPVSPFTA